MPLALPWLRKPPDTVGEPLLQLSSPASLHNDLWWQGGMMSSKTYGYRVRQQYPTVFATSHLFLMSSPEKPIIKVLVQPQTTDNNRKKSVPIGQEPPQKRPIRRQCHHQHAHSTNHKQHKYPHITDSSSHTHTHTPPPSTIQLPIIRQKPSETRKQPFLRHQTSTSSSLPSQQNCFHNRSTYS